MVGRPVLRYFGGKWILAPWIISFFPAHRVYCEPFGGAASVLLRKPRAFAEIYNDLDGEVVDVFRCLQNPRTAEDLRRRLELTTFSRAEYETAHGRGSSRVERARRTIIKSFMGHGADSLTGTRSGFRRNTFQSNRVASLDWTNYPPEIPAFVERVRGVIVEQVDAFELMTAIDSPDVLFYLDPPYHPTTRGRKRRYRHEAGAKVHHRLTEFLPTLKGMVVLSGYGTALYDERLDWPVFRRETFADGGRARTESVWLNPACAARQAQLEFEDVTRELVNPG